MTGDFDEFDALDAGTRRGAATTARARRRARSAAESALPTQCPSRTTGDLSDDRGPWRRGQQPRRPRTSERPPGRRRSTGHPRVDDATAPPRRAATTLADGRARGRVRGRPPPVARRPLRPRRRLARGPTCPPRRGAGPPRAGRGRREQAQELVAAGRVDGRRDGRPPSRRRRSTTRRPIRRHRRSTTSPAYASRGGHKLAGALDVFGPHGLDVDGPALPGRRAPRPAASPTSCCAAAPRSCSRSTSGYGLLGLAAPAGPAGHGARPHQRARPEPDGAAGRAPDLVVADLSFISLGLVLPALVPVRDAGRRPGADGQAAVRGRQGAAGRGAGSSATRRCAASGTRAWPPGGRARARRPRRHGEPAARAVRERGVLPVAAARRRRLDDSRPRPSDRRRARSDSPPAFDAASPRRSCSSRTPGGPRPATRPGSRPSV